MRRIWLCCFVGGRLMLRERRGGSMMVIGPVGEGSKREKGEAAIEVFLKVVL